MSIVSMIPWKKVLLKAYNKLAINREGQRRDGPIIVVVSTLIALAAYYPIVERIDPSKNVYRSLFRLGVGDSYSFYTGTTGGEYKRVGESLMRQETDFSIQAVPRKASHELRENETRREGNLKMVLNKRDALAIVSKDKLERAEIGNQVRVVAPLYGEKMHVLFRLGDFELQKGGPLPTLSANPTPELKEFFRNARVYMASGESRKGSYVSDLVMLSCGLDAKKLIYGPSIGDAVTGLWNSKLGGPNEEGIDVAFIIAGSPLAELTPYLKTDLRLGLMSIDPEVVTSMNTTFGTRYSPTTFNDKYDDWFDRVWTLETPAMLVASTDVSGEVLLEVSRLLNEIASEGGPISEYSAHDRVQRELPGTVRTHAEAWGSFAAFVLLLSPFLVAFLTWGVSSVKLNMYFEQMTNTYKQRLPENVDLTSIESGLVVPKPRDDHEAVLKELVMGMSEILEMISRIRVDYNTGGITVTHQAHLVDTVYQLKQIFMRNIGQRLNAVIENGTEITKDQIVRYYAAGYIDLGSYQHLVSLIEPSHVFTPNAALRAEDSREFRSMGKARKT